MPNIYESISATFDGVAVCRVGEVAGSDHLGVSVYELQPAKGWSSITTFSARSCWSSCAEHLRSERRRVGGTS
jgi:hypothetical protein